MFEMQMFSFRSWFSLSGHNQAIILKDIDAKDVLEIEEFVGRVPAILKSVKLRNKKNASADDIQNMLCHFCGPYAWHTEFKFPPGDRKLLLLIGNTVSRNLESDAKFFEDDSSLRNCNMIATPFGEVFCDLAMEHSRPKQRKKNVEKTVDSTSTVCLTPAQMYSDETLTYFVERLKLCLESRLNQFGEKKPKIIAIDFDSMISALTNAGVLQCPSKQPNSTAKTAAATIECFCSTPPTKIKVFFALKTVSASIIAQHLDEHVKKPDETPSNKLNQHIASCWSLSNYQHHIKKIHPGVEQHDVIESELNDSSTYTLRIAVYFKWATSQSFIYALSKLK